LRDFFIPQHSLPVYAKKSELTNASSEFPTEELDQFWSVKDMYTFENVGFTHNVGAVRYLTCADCELGPIGFQDTSSDTPLFYVALARTKLKTSDTPNRKE
uniref:Guanine nucleotide exchange factor n=1 Tax=Echinostoma caproni TaxID=27848 RepID=A0A183B0G4_9TREM